MLRFIPGPALPALLVALFAVAIATPAAATLCSPPPNRLVAVCENGSCRAQFAIEWVGTWGAPCAVRPEVVEIDAANRDAADILDSLGASPPGGIVAIDLPWFCRLFQPGVAPECTVDGVEILSAGTSAAALAAVEDDWRGRAAEGLAQDRSYEFRLVTRLIATTIFAAALPWLATAGPAGFPRARMRASLAASALLGGAKLAFGVWLSPFVLGCLLLALWLPGCLKNAPPFGPGRCVVHLLAILLQLATALWHYISGSESLIYGMPYPAFLALPSRVATAVLLVAAAASAGYLLIALVRAALRIRKRLLPTG